MIPSLTYHAIGCGSSPVFVSSSLFEEQLGALAAAGYQTVSLSWLVDHLSGEKALPEKAVVLTFDDGYRSVYSEAWPHLRARGFTATLFLVTDYCGRSNQWPGQGASVPNEPLLTWEQVGQLAADGWEIGAHTRTHPVLPLLSGVQIEDEVLGSQTAIREQIGQPARIFAQPYGASNQVVDKVVQQHFDGAVSTDLGLVERGSDVYHLPRIDAQYWQPTRTPAPEGTVFRHYLSLRQRLRVVRRWFVPDWDRNTARSVANG